MRNFLNNLRYKLGQFMVGRYGPDDFYKFLTALTFVLIILELFTKSALLSLITMAIIIYNMFRVYSKNYQKRYTENQKYLRIRNKFVKWFKVKKRHFDQRKDYAFRTCPSCKQELRLPKKKGKHTVVCPKCKNEFTVKI